MKTTNRFKLANIRGFVTRAALTGLVAVAAFLAAPGKASAQVAFGVQFGRLVYRRPFPAPAPVFGGYYHGPVYAYRGGFNPYAYERRLRWERRERWQHERGFYR